MPLLWCAISAHGFGHAAQVVPVLNELGRRRADLSVVLRTHVPHAFFKSRLQIAWEIQPAQLDIGCIQRGPLTIDWPATWEAHRTFHQTWTHRLEDEAAAIRRAGADLVLGNTPYLALAAGAAAGVPSLALASLTWDEILRPHQDPLQPWQKALLADIRRAYGQASQALRMDPGLPMPAFSRLTEIGPIASPHPAERDRLRHVLNLRGRDAVVLVGFGGIPLSTLPFAQMEAMEGFHFLIDRPGPPGSQRIHCLTDLSIPFSTLLSSVDVIMTKPGYGTIVEAVSVQTPVVYVRRHEFADEQPLVEYLHRYGRGVELSRTDLEAGHWEQTLRQALALPPAAILSPPVTGPREATDIVEGWLARS